MYRDLLIACFSMQVMQVIDLSQHPWCLSLLTSWSILNLIALSGFQRRPCYQVLQKLFIYRQYVEQLLLFPLWCGS